MSDLMQGFQLLGNGDVYNWQQHDDHVRLAGVATTMIARAALIKPWIFTEIKVPPCDQTNPSELRQYVQHIDLVHADIILNPGKRAKVQNCASAQLRC